MSVKIVWRKKKLHVKLGGTFSFSGSYMNINNALKSGQINENALHKAMK